VDQTFTALDWESSDNDLISERGFLKALQPQERLFHADEQKTEFYRVEAGILVILTVAADGSSGDYKLAYPGDFLGLGFLSQYGSVAKALIASTVSCFSVSDLDALALGSSDLHLQRAEAVQREFDYVRDACMARNVQGLPIHMVANLLVVISRLDELEGRDPNVVSEELDSSFFAKLLRINIELLTHSLKGLQILGLIDWDPEKGLRITDRDRLETFGNSVPANDLVAKADHIRERFDHQVAEADRLGRRTVA
jgi:CRP/FNR family transcriptional regulator